MSHNVFISYADEDKTIADAVCAKLESEGIRCWISSRDAEPGKPWSDSIIRAITESQVMVLIFSSSANTSVHITREVNHAIDKGLPLIPFRIENVEPTGSLEFYLDVTHWLDAIDPPLENQLRRLAETIKRLLKEPVTPPFRRPAPAPLNAARLWLWCGAGLLVIILIIFLGRYISSRNDLVVTRPPTPTPPISSPPASTLTPVPKETSSSSPVKVEPNAPTPVSSPTSGTTEPPDDTEKRINEALEGLESRKMSVSIQAIDKLEFLAKTSTKQSWQIVRIVTAYIRRETPWQGGNAKPIPENIQAALKFLGRRKGEYKHGEDERLDLRNLDLRGAVFFLEGQRANFNWVRLNGAHLEGAIMKESDFQCADLSGAYMAGVDVWQTDFYGADLSNTKGTRPALMEGAWNRDKPLCKD